MGVLLSAQNKIRGQTCHKFGSRGFSDWINRLHSSPHYSYPSVGEFSHVNTASSSGSSVWGVSGSSSSSSSSGVVSMKETKSSSASASASSSSHASSNSAS